MNITFKVLISIAVLWSFVYSVSFAVSEFKNKNVSGGIVALILVLGMCFSYAKNVWL